MALHEQSVGATDEWYTPPQVFKAMDVVFDMDVSSPGRHVTPWIPAHAFLTYGALERPWFGFVWMNPPFGGRNGLAPWLAKFFAHGDGVALVPDRTSAPWWHVAARQADALLVVGRPNPPRGQPNKIRFVPGAGQKGDSPAQGTTLLAAGARGVKALQNASRNGLGLLLVRGGADAERAALNTPPQEEGR